MTTKIAFLLVTLLTACSETATEDESRTASDHTGCGTAEWLPWCNSRFTFGPKVVPVGVIWFAPDDEAWIGNVHTLTRCRDGQCANVNDYPAPADTGSLWDEWEIGSIWGRNSSDVWVVNRDLNGGSSSIVHWDGSAWTTVASGVRSLNVISGSPDGTVVAVAQAGKVVVIDQGTTTILEVPPTVADPMGGITMRSYLNGVFVTSARDIWVGGDNSNVFHWDGSSWATYQPLEVYRRYATPGDQYASLNNREYQFSHIWARAPNDVWAAANFLGVSQGQNAILRFNGSQWAVVRQLPGDQALHGLTQRGNETWFCGDNVILHYDGSQFIDDALPGSEAISLYKISYNPTTGRLRMVADRPDSFFGDPNWYLVFEKQS